MRDGDGETRPKTTMRNHEGRDCYARERQDDSVNEKVSTSSLK